MRHKYMKFWLIQRGKFRNNLKEATGFLGPKPCNLIDPDYMGSAEFEFGAIPKAYRRIHGRFNKYKLHITDLKTYGGVPFCLYCLDNHYEEILSEIKTYLETDYRLKERSGMKSHFNNSSYYKFDRTTNFWWCIDSTTPDDDDKLSIGDWIAFTGATDRQKAFMRVLANDHKEWWESKTKEEQQEEYLKSFDRY